MTRYAKRLVFNADVLLNLFRVCGIDMPFDARVVHSTGTYDILEIIVETMNTDDPTFTELPENTLPTNYWIDLKPIIAEIEAIQDKLFIELGIMWPEPKILLE